MSELVQPIRLGVTKILPGFWDEGLAIGLGIIVTDVIGNMVKATIGRVVPAEWVDPATEGLIGFVILLLGETVAPIGWLVYTRLAGIAALGLAIADAAGILLGLGTSTIRGLGSTKISEAISGESQVSFA